MEKPTFKKSIQLAILVVLAIGLSHCNLKKSLPKQELKGTYHFTKDGIYKATLEFLSYPNFSYDWQILYSNGRTPGHYEVQEDSSIILNSYQRPELGVYQSDISSVENKNQNYISILVAEAETDYEITEARCDFFLDGKKETDFTDYSGKCYFEKRQVDSIVVSDINREAVFWTPEHKNHNEFKVALEPGEYYEYFIHDKVEQVDGKLLVPPRYFYKKYFFMNLYDEVN